MRTGRLRAMLEILSLRAVGPVLIAFMFALSASSPAWAHGGSHDHRFSPPPPPGEVVEFSPSGTVVSPAADPSPADVRGEGESLPFWPFVAAAPVLGVAAALLVRSRRSPSPSA